MSVLGKLRVWIQSLKSLVSPLSPPPLIFRHLSTSGHRGRIKIVRISFGLDQGFNLETQTFSLSSVASSQYLLVFFTWLGLLLYHSTLLSFQLVLAIASIFINLSVYRVMISQFPSPILSVAADVVSELQGEEALYGLWNRMCLSFTLAFQIS